MAPAIGMYVLTSHRITPTTISATATFIIVAMPAGSLSLFKVSIPHLAMVCAREVPTRDE
jgi:hypothetical protein